MNLYKNYTYKWDDISNPSTSKNKWVKHSDGYVICQNCGEPPLIYPNGRYALSKFCPSCGAKMKGAENEQIH